MYREAIQGNMIAVKHMFDNDISVLMIRNPNLSKLSVEIIVAQQKDGHANSGVFPKHTAPIYAQRVMLDYLISLIMHVDTYERSQYALSAGFALLLASIDAEYFGMYFSLYEDVLHFNYYSLRFGDIVCPLAYFI